MGSPGTPPAPADPLSHGWKSHGAQVLAHREAGSTCRELESPGRRCGSTRGMGASLHNHAAPNAAATSALPRHPGAVACSASPHSGPSPCPISGSHPSPVAPSPQTTLIPLPPGHFSTSGGLSPAPPAGCLLGHPESSLCRVLEGPGVSLGESERQARLGPWRLREDLGLSPAVWPWQVHLPLTGSASW